MHAAFPSDHIFFHSVTLVMFDKVYKLWSSSLCSLLRSPTTSSLLGPYILLSTLFSNTIIICSSLNVRDQVSHPYKTRGKIMVLYILIFKFLERRQEDVNRMITSIPWNMLLISSWMQFLFVTFVPKYLNFATFSKDCQSVNYDFILHFVGKI